jgi:hypothetical protein
MLTGKDGAAHTNRDVQRLNGQLEKELRHGVRFRCQDISRFQGFHDFMSMADTTENKISLYRPQLHHSAWNLRKSTSFQPQFLPLLNGTNDSIYPTGS